MKVIRTRAALLKYRSKLKGRIGFVPTMGALHEGHLSLVRRARRECENTIVSIFVNPTQFGPNEDYLKYPRSEATDLKMLRAEKCDAVFLPKSVKEIYARKDETQIRARRELNAILCGPFRPGHFDGVCTVVFKLFSFVRPDRAYFGEKDYQQVKVIEAMVQDFALPIRIVPCATRRESSGLAMSSRNQYLNSKERQAASVLFETLSKAKSLPLARRKLSSVGFQIQYLERHWGRWLFAGYFAGVRLIDNLKRGRGF